VYKVDVSKGIAMLVVDVLAIVLGILIGGVEMVAKVAVLIVGKVDLSKGMLNAALSCCVSATMGLLPQPSS
jgi:hypothetical protein